MTLYLNGATGVSGVDGSAGTPAIQGTDTNTGISFGSDVIIGSTGGTERFRCDSSGRLLVGTSSSFGDNAQLQVVSQSNSFAGQFFYAAANGNGTYLGLNKARGSIGSPAVVNSGDDLGAIIFKGHGGSSYHDGAYIIAQADGACGNNDLPTRLVFSTTPDGQSSPIARMTINNAGNVTLSGANRSLQIGDSGAAYLYFTSTSGGSEISHNNNYLQLLTSQVSGVLVRAGTGGVSLAVNATAWASASDERLKTDLDPIASGLEKVGSLRAVTGRYETDDLKIRRSFLIAQDVQAVLPEAVDDSNSDELGLRYTEVIPLLVAALKESKERIERLEAEMAEVKAQLS